MLRMIIADDEAVIRETICTLIDWGSLGIEIVATCKNGLEAYDAILDEYPDIVLTDIKMPGLSGLELMKRLKDAGGENIEFIILSGFEEFSFAAEAMKYGVRHYLLKPCNEQKIIEAARDAADICRARKRRALLEQSQNADFLRTNLLHSILLEGLAGSASVADLLSPYRALLDFDTTPYRLHYIYFLEEENLDSVLREINAFPSPPVWILYVNLALAVIYPADGEKTFTAFLDALDAPAQAVSLQHKTECYDNLSGLLEALLKKLCRFHRIDLIKGLHRSEIQNSRASYHRLEECAALLVSGTAKRAQGEQKLGELFRGISDPALRLSLTTDLLMKLSPQCNTLMLAEMLEKMEAAPDGASAAETLLAALPRFLPASAGAEATDGLAAQIQQYLSEHLSDSRLSLKWLAENYLYMNVDYVSKQFFKQTGKKFSAYLNELRIKKAKELLQACGSANAAMIAEQVGCSASPQYFSQWFKKHTGLSPTQYLKQL